MSRVWETGFRIWGWYAGMGNQMEKKWKVNWNLGLNGRIETCRSRNGSEGPFWGSGEGYEFLLGSGHKFADT